MREILTERFIRYARQHTTSDPKSDTFPSTPHQMKFAVILAGELNHLGLSEVAFDENGYVTATIPAFTVPQILESHRENRWKAGRNSSLGALPSLR